MGPSLLLELPEELLVDIIKIAAVDDDQHLDDLSNYHEKYDSCSVCRQSVLDKLQLRNLATVCRRFSRIVQPLQYQAISFGGRYIELPDEKLLRLRDELSENHQFHSHCRQLKLLLSDICTTPHQRILVSKLPEWLTRTRCLYLVGGFREEETRTRITWALLNQFALKCKQIEHLRIEAGYFGVDLKRVFENLSFPNLKALEINGTREWKDTKMTLEPQRHRTAPFTFLELSDCEENPRVLSLLLQWPAVLTHFKFQGLCHSPYAMDYPMFESWLLIHRYTLKHVQISYLSEEGNKRLFNATLFPNLQYLGLSRWQSGVEDIKSKADIPNLLGPSVKIFHWGFRIYDQVGEPWDSFGDMEADWLRSLAQAAIDAKAPLRTVIIQFFPEPIYPADSKVYPWDRMDRVRDEVFEPNGLDLVYNEPSQTKEKWLQLQNSVDEDNYGDDRDFISEEEDPADLIADWERDQLQEAEFDEQEREAEAY